MCDHHHHHHHHSEESSLKFFITYASTGWSLYEGKILICYSGMLIASSIFEIITGFQSLDSHIVSEGFHTVFHALCIWSAMIALAYTSKHRSADKYCPFGYSRAQLVAAFGNLIFIFFILFFSFFEAIHEILSDEVSDSNQSLLSTFTLKLVIHCLFFIHLWPYILSKDKYSNDNLGVVGLHCLALLGTELIRILSLYFEVNRLSYPFYHAEAVVNILWMGVMLLIIWPFVGRVGNVLLLCSPSGKIKENIQRKIREISLVEGVVAVKEEKIWMINSSEVIGSIKIEVHGEGKGVVAKTQEIMKSTTSVFIVEIENSDKVEA